MNILISKYSYVNVNARSKCMALVAGSFVCSRSYSHGGYLLGRKKMSVSDSTNSCWRGTWSTYVSHDQESNSNWGEGTSDKL